MSREMFRKRDFGDVEVEVNSHSMTGDFFVDRSRIGTHEEWQSNPNPNKPGKIVQVQDSVMDSARRGADAMRHRSSFRDESVPKRDGNFGCVPCGYGCSDGPLTARRGDDND